MKNKTNATNNNGTGRFFFPLSFLLGRQLLLWMKSRSCRCGKIVKWGEKAEEKRKFSKLTRSSIGQISSKKPRVLPHPASRTLRERICIFIERAGRVQTAKFFGIHTPVNTCTLLFGKRKVRMFDWKPIYAVQTAFEA